MASTGSQSEIEILEDEDGPPTEEQVLEYAEFLGMDLDTERHLLWIAREGVAAPVPKPWKTCTEKGEVFYFNFETEESSWDHPCDGQYRKLLQDWRNKGPEEAMAIDDVTKPECGSDRGSEVRKAEDTDSNVSEEEKANKASAIEKKPGNFEQTKEEFEDASFVSEMVGSESEDERQTEEKRATGTGARAAHSLTEKEEDDNASFVSDVVASDSEASSRRAVVVTTSVDEKAAEGAWSESSSPHSASDQGLDEVFPRLTADKQDSPMDSPTNFQVYVQAPDSKDEKMSAPLPAGRGIGLGTPGGGGHGLSDGPEPPSSNMSEVSEDFRSDWGAPSPLGSGGLSREAHSLEVSTSGDAGSLSGAASIPQVTASVPPADDVKTWAALQAELAALCEVLSAAARLREQQAAFLFRLKC